MRVKFSHLFPCMIIVMMTWAGSALAQDDMPGPSNANNNVFNTNDPQVYEEKPLLLEQEGRQLRPGMKADSLDHLKLAPPAKQKAGSDPRKNKEDDPLNFNFLYYIIKNFKGSDLMME